MAKNKQGRPGHDTQLPARLGHADTGVANDAGGGKALKAPHPKKQPTRTEAVRAAKAKITRRNRCGAAGCPERRALASESIS